MSEVVLLKMAYQSIAEQLQFLAGEIDRLYSPSTCGANPDATALVKAEHLVELSMALRNARLILLEMAIDRKTADAVLNDAHVWALRQVLPEAVRSLCRDYKPRAVDEKIVPFRGKGGAA